MPYDKGLAERLMEVITQDFEHIHGFKENRMMGGFGYLLNGHMCVGIFQDSLIIRVGVEKSEKILQEPHVRVMDLTKKVMKGWATIEPEGMADDEDLQRFCKYAIDFVLTLPPK